MLLELGKFIRGSTGGQNVPRGELSRCALQLLQTLPASQSAVLQYLSNLYDDAANKNLFPIQLSLPATDETTNLDDVIEETSQVILEIIHGNSGPWAPIISSWAFDLLGHISVKYSGRIQVPPSSSLNQVLQVWMTCKATKQLIHVAMECFAAMASANPDICVDSLLEASVKYTPYFDWVVAHIGSCFPTTIITRVLMSGLKDFCIHGATNAMDTVPADSVDDKASKMASVVGILGHLASKHGQDIRKALIHLFKESLEPEDDHMKMSTVTFLLQMASMSPLLLHILTTDFLAILTPDVLNTLHDQFYRWSSVNSNFFSLLSLGVHLVMKSEAGAYRFFNFLLDVASPAEEHKGLYKEAVRTTAVTLLDQLCVDLQRAAYNRRGDALDIPFLSSLSKHTIDIANTLILSEGRRGEWLGEILTYTALYRGEVSAADILTHLLTNATTIGQLGHFVRLHRQLESAFPHMLSDCVTRFMDSIHSPRLSGRYASVRNLLAVVTWMKAERGSPPNSVVIEFSRDLGHHIAAFTSLLTNPDLRIAVMTARILHTIGLDRQCPGDVVLELCNATGMFLFTILTVRSYRESGHAFGWCKKLIQDLCVFTTARNILLRLLLDLALFTDFATTLGGEPVTIVSSPPSGDRDISLLRENRTHGLSLTLPRAHSGVFHAGVIGNGRRHDSTVTKIHISQDIILRNRTYFVDILLLCTTLEKSPTHKSQTDEVTMTDSRLDPFFYVNESGRRLAELLVDLLTPDVLYNSILWPEEECIPLTIERDLHVSRHFEQHPILWDILDLYSTNQAFVCYLSPVLRSLMATVINHFDSSRHITPYNSKMHVTRGRRIIEALHKGKQLPPPLCHVGEVLPHLSQHEVSLLLTNIWKYVKECPPKIDNTGKRTGCDARYKKVILSVLHSNIDTLGSCYSQFFPLPS